jgi:superfamily I DNA and/or RNA helicase
MLLSSRIEAKAVAEVLGQLSSESGCDLQVLAPYNLQVGVIRNEIARAAARGKLPHLADFRKPEGEIQFGATIDGFQGEEADIVVISLVRNNHAAASGGVGFLSERPRLNVMLSRARRKLILVGCWDFFAKRATPEAWKDPENKLHHIATVFHELEEAMRNGTACKVTFPGAASR